ARLAELATGVGIGAGFLSQPLEDDPGSRTGVAATFGVGEDIELDLADAEVRELLGERAVGVVERLGSDPAFRPEKPQDIRVRGDVIRVVRADDLDLVDPCPLPGSRRDATSEYRETTDPGQSNDHTGLRGASSTWPRPRWFVFDRRGESRGITEPSDHEPGADVQRQV